MQMRYIAPRSAWRIRLRLSVAQTAGSKRLRTRPAASCEHLKDLRSITIVAFREVQLRQRNLEREDLAARIDPRLQLLARSRGSLVHVDITRNVERSFLLAHRGSGGFARTHRCRDGLTV